MSERNNSKVRRPLLVDPDIGSVRRNIHIKNNVDAPDGKVYANNPTPSNNALRLAQAFLGVGGGFQQLGDTEVMEARMDYSERKQAEAEAKQASKEAEWEAKQQRREDAAFWANIEGVKLLHPLSIELNNKLQAPEFSAEQAESVHEWYSSAVQATVDGADRETRNAMGPHMKQALLGGFDMIQNRMNKLRVDTTSQDFNSLYTNDLSTEQIKASTQTLIQNNIEAGGSRAEALGIAQRVSLQYLDTLAENGNSEELSDFRQMFINSGVLTPGTDEYYTWNEEADKFALNAETRQEYDEKKFADEAHQQAADDFSGLARGEIKALMQEHSGNAEEMTAEKRIENQAYWDEGYKALQKDAFYSEEHRNVLARRRQQVVQLLSEANKLNAAGDYDAGSYGVLPDVNGKFQLIDDDTFLRIADATERRYLDSAGQIKPLSDEAIDLYWRLLDEEFAREGATGIKQLNPRYRTKWEPEDWTVDYVAHPNNKQTILNKIKRMAEDNPRKSLYEHVVTAVPDTNPEYVAVRSYLATEIETAQRKKQIEAWEKEATKRQREFEENTELWQENYLTANQSLDSNLFGLYQTSLTMSNDIVEIQEYNEDYRVINIANKLYENETGESLSLKSPETIAETINYYIDSGKIKNVQRENYNQLYLELTDELEPYAAESIELQQEDMKLLKKVEKKMPALEEREAFVGNWGIEIK